MASCSEITAQGKASVCEQSNPDEYENDSWDWSFPSYEDIAHGFHDYLWPEHGHDYLETQTLIDDSVISDSFRVRIVHKEFSGVGTKIHAAENRYTYSYIRFGWYMGDFNTYAGVGGRVFFPSGSNVKLIDGLEFGGSFRTPVLSTGLRLRYRKSTGLQKYNPVRFGLTMERTFVENGERIRSITYLNPAASLGLPGTGYDIRLFEEALLSARASYDSAKTSIKVGLNLFDRIKMRYSGVYKAQLELALNDVVANLRSVHEGKWAIPVKDEHLRAVVTNSYLPLDSAIARSVGVETARGFFAWHWFLSGLGSFNEEVFAETDANVSALKAGEIMTDQFAAILCGYTGGYTTIKTMQVINLSGIHFKRVTSGIGGGIVGAFFATLGYNETRQLLHEIELPEFLSELIVSSDNPELVIGGLYFAMNLLSSLLIAREVVHLAGLAMKVPTAIKNAYNSFSDFFKGDPPSLPPTGGVPTGEGVGRTAIDSDYLNFGGSENSKAGNYTYFNDSPSWRNALQYINYEGNAEPILKEVKFDELGIPSGVGFSPIVGGAVNVYSSVNIPRVLPIRMLPRLAPLVP